MIKRDGNVVTTFIKSKLTHFIFLIPENVVIRRLLHRYLLYSLAQYVIWFVRLEKINRMAQCDLWN